MIFKGNSLFNSSKITSEMINILSDEEKFESIYMSEPDIIFCYIHGSKYFPRTENNCPIINCLFATYPDKVVFGVIYQNGINCEYIENRLNDELPYLKDKIGKFSDKLSHLVVLDVVDNDTLKYLKKTANINLRNQILKTKIDEFFESKGNKIISKIVEIMIGIRL